MAAKAHFVCAWHVGLTWDVGGNVPELLLKMSHVPKLHVNLTEPCQDV